jgi:hypothetical protein
LFPRESDIGKQAVIEPREGVEVPRPGNSDSSLLPSALAETDHFVPPESRSAGLLRLNQGQHSKVSLINPY